MQLPDLKKKSKKTIPREEIENNLKKLKEFLGDLPFYTNITDWTGVKNYGGFWIVAYREKGFIVRLFRFMFYPEMNEELLRNRFNAVVKPEGDLEIIKVPEELEVATLKMYGDSIVKQENNLKNNYKLVKEYFGEVLTEKDLQALKEIESPIEEREEMPEEISGVFDKGAFGIPRLVSDTRNHIIKRGREQNIKEDFRRQGGNAWSFNYSSKLKTKTNKIQLTFGETKTAEDYVEEVLRTIDTELYRVMCALSKYSRAKREGYLVPLTDIMRILSPNQKTFKMEERELFTKKLRELESLPRFTATQGNGKQLIEIRFKFIDFTGRPQVYSTYKKDCIDPKTGEVFKKGDYNMRVYNKISFEIMGGIPFSGELTWYDDKLLTIPRKYETARELGFLISERFRQNYKKGTGEPGNLKIKITLEDLITRAKLKTEGTTRKERYTNKKRVENALDYLVKDNICISEYTKIDNIYIFTPTNKIDNIYIERKKNLEKKRIKT
jgi:hypothetical protein